MPPQARGCPSTPTTTHRNDLAIKLSRSEPSLTGHTCRYQPIATLGGDRGHRADKNVVPTSNASTVPKSALRRQTNIPPSHLRRLPVDRRAEGVNAKWQPHCPLCGLSDHVNLTRSEIVDVRLRTLLASAHLRNYWRGDFVVECHPCTTRIVNSQCLRAMPGLSKSPIESLRGQAADRKPHSSSVDSKD